MYLDNTDKGREAFSKVKGLVRKAEARSREAPVEAMGKALDAVSVRDACGFFGHCGYATITVQSLYEQRYRARGPTAKPNLSSEPACGRPRLASKERGGHREG